MRYCKEITYEELKQDISFKIFVNVLEDEVDEDDNILSEEFDVSVIEAAGVTIGSKAKTFFSDLDEDLQEELKDFISEFTLNELLDLPDYEFIETYKED